MRVCDQPGCRLTLPFEGTAVGLYLAAGPDAGTVDYRIDGGAVRRRGLFTPWSAGLHLNTLEVLADGLAPGPHELRLWLASASNPASRGQAARIAHFAVG